MLSTPWKVKTSEYQNLKCPHRFQLEMVSFPGIRISLAIAFKHDNIPTSLKQGHTYEEINSDFVTESVIGFLLHRIALESHESGSAT